MEILNQQSLEQLGNKGKIFAIIFLIIGLIGFLDASFLTLEHYRGSIPACGFLTGCNEVLSSPYSQIRGVPLALTGVAYYLFVIFGAIYYLDTKKLHWLHILSGFTLIGIIASLYFVYLQAFVIKALCTYCLVSATTSTLLFINGLYVFKHTK